MQANYKVNKGLAQACQRDIMENKCIQDKDPGFKHARLSKIVLCLEHIIKDGRLYMYSETCFKGQLNIICFSMAGVLL